MLENDVYTTTLEDVEGTASEFGRIVIHLPERDMLIVMDDTLIGKECIKQFDDNPHGYTLARRWAVRMNDNDEESKQSFEDLRREYLEEIQAPK